ncbi:MAG: manganese efflux pump [Oscillospiraceae bacterium]|nr:manganese efflux pump [Oscillospiraceae bacterium]
MLKILLLTAAVCTDGFAAAVGIGAAGIKIPAQSSVIISFTGALFLSCSAAFADLIGKFIPERVCGAVSFILLILLGLFNLFQGYFKRLAERLKNGGKAQNPAVLFFDGTAADADNSKSISPREAVALAAALSADSLVTGVSAGLDSLNVPLLAVVSFAAGLMSISLGCQLGRKISSSLKINLGWLCGAALIVLAFLK